jgi:hypothetical protein
MEAGTMDWLFVSLLALSMLVALYYLGRTAYAASHQRSEASAWKRSCCLVGLAVGVLAWCSALGLIVLAWFDVHIAIWPSGWNWGLGLIEFGTFSTPVALVMGVVTRTQPGGLLAKAEAAQMLFWGTI